MSNSLDSESPRTPAPPSSSIPSVASMAEKRNGPIDRVAIAVIGFALIAFLILSYGFLNQMKGHDTFSPVRPVSQFLHDIERQVMGYLTEIERAFEVRKSGKQKAKKYILVGYRYYKEGEFNIQIL